MDVESAEMLTAGKEMRESVLMDRETAKFGNDRGT